MNVLIIDNSTYITGANKSFSEFTKALEKEISFFWAVTEGIPDEELKVIVGSQPYERFEFIEISRKFLSNLRYFPRLFSNARRLSRIIDEKKISIVHVSDFYNMLGVALKIMNPTIKLVYHVRLLRNSYIGPMYGLFISVVKRFADAIVCTSQAVSGEVGPATRKVVIYDSQFFPEAFEAAIVRPEVKTIAYIGHILPGKGQAHAVRAFASVAEEHPELKMHFIGKYDHSQVSVGFKKQLDELIHNEALSDRIEFRGLVADIEDELKKYDLVLNLSESESFSMVCLDALKAGVPLIASDCGGPRELFEHEKSGLLVPNKDVPAAANALRTLMLDFRLRKKFSDEGRKYVSKKFNVVDNAKLLNGLYTDLLVK